jgi:predicted transcriptional regulator
VPAFTGRLPQDIADKLDDIATKRDRSRCYVAAEAIGHFVALEASHDAEIEAGRVERTRELVVGSTSYIVAYRVHADAIEVLTIPHAAQAWPDGL